MVTTEQMIRRKIKILLASEFVLFRKGIKSLIEKENNMTVIGEASGKNEIFSLLTNSRPDILILNITSPVGTFNSICKNLHEKYPKLPILLFLENSFEFSIAESIINGVRGIIWKENKKDELVEAINKVAQGGLYFENPDNCSISCHLSQKIGLNREACESSHKLSLRETEVMKLIADGLTYQEIANQLMISRRTVETHKNHIMDKLNVNKVSEIIRYAIVNNVN